jgi:transcriptional regulator with XRE-family HTH domain
VTRQQHQTDEPRADQTSGTKSQALDVLSDPWEQAGLIPPRRLGTLLSRARAATGTTLAEMATISEGWFTMSALASIERGTTPVFGPDLHRIVELYGVEADSLIPTRSKLVVDLDEGRMWVSHTPHKARLDRRAAHNDVLSRYLSMVYCMRDIDPGTHITLRVEDLDVLGESLGTGVSRIVDDLEHLMDDPGGQVSWRARILKRSVLIPAAGLLVAFCGAGALILASGDEPAGASERPVATAERPGAEGPAVEQAGLPTTEVRLGPAVVQERLGDGTPGPIVER